MYKMDIDIVIYKITKYADYRDTKSLKLINKEWNNIIKTYGCGDFRYKYKNTKNSSIKILKFKTLITELIYYINNTNIIFYVSRNIYGKVVFMHFFYYLLNSNINNIILSTPPSDYTDEFETISKELGLNIKIVHQSTNNN